MKIERLFLPLPPPKGDKVLQTISFFPPSEGVGGGKDPSNFNP